MKIQKTFLLTAILLTCQTVFSQDTLQYNRSFDPTNVKDSIVFYEIRKKNADSTLTVLTTNKDFQYLSLVKYSDYQHSELHGKCKYWYPNGTVNLERTYKKGLKQGWETSYYENGQIYRKIQWEQDSIVAANFFNPDGSPKTAVFKEDLEEDMPSPSDSILQASHPLFHLSRYVNYPPSARENNISGEVRALVILGKNGRIEHREILKSPHHSLSKEMLRTIDSLPPIAYAPNGIPVRQRIIAKVRFRLE